MTLTRRKFLQIGSYGATAASLQLHSLRVFSQSAELPDKHLVVFFLRGAADGLYMVSPTTAKLDAAQKDFYLSKRGVFFDEELNYKQFDNAGIATTAAGHLLGNSGFMFHPKMEKLASLFNNKKLSVIHGIGGAGTTSHFKAQDAMEWALPYGQAGNSTGWLNDVIPYITNPGSSPTTAVSIGAKMAASLTGNNTDYATTISNLSEFKLPNLTNTAEKANYLSYLNGITHHPSDSYHGLKAAGKTTLDVDTTVSNLPAEPVPSGHSRQLHDIARLIKADTGLKIATAELGGWDTHTNQIIQFGNSINTLNNFLDGFIADLGAAAWKKTTVLVLTEFGRTFDVDGTTTVPGSGTDHGYGAAALVLSGAENFIGGQLIGSDFIFPTTDQLPIQKNTWRVGTSTPQRLYLPVTTDFRSVYKALLENIFALNPRQIIDALKGYTGEPVKLFI